MRATVDVETADGTAEAYLTGEPGDPGVLLYMDAIGLRPQIQEMADRIAAWGYVVLAPHVFYREGRAADFVPTTDLRRPAERERFFAGGVMDRVHRLTPELAERDAAAWVAALQQHAGAGPIGVTGYCMGARLAVRTAGWHPGTVVAVGGFHGGGLVTDAPDSPHRSIAASTADYAFGHADQDPGMPIEAVAALEETLQQAGRPHVNEIYAGAAHGFTMADTSVYDESATERHFDELRTLLDRTL
ncbi:dienelactone hydrolase family protein [Nocardioides sp. MAH-18]|uniref:Dienelactone hydrolase family protein n=1 Tax=Nocardioides agri TaxID=2682843 RepID=A0A6L6XXK5_9ACTN|nr:MULTISPECIES: dienelactone hydrolase family protein [unclassified Nocardioides]MBA2956323.1 dienelactone hydrolase family protein [Nocardioides sp. CGMCC 1.13656]MVQ51166.1 dienelactone hydrolase family protein [Nocardioides sp. MAH-18]